MNPFWISGCLFAVWALILAFALGLRSVGFPRSDGQMKAVMGISIVLAIFAISGAIIGGITGWGESTGFRHGAESEQHSE